VLVTILVGIVAAFVGTALARAVGIPTATNGIDWLELLSRSSWPRSALAWSRQ